MIRWDRSSDVLSVFKGLGKFFLVVPFFFFFLFSFFPSLFFCFLFLLLKVNIDHPMIGDTRVSQAPSRVQLMSELGLTANLI